jgi:hypothetical protein
MPRPRSTTRTAASTPRKTRAVSKLGTGSRTRTVNSGGPGLQGVQDRGPVRQLAIVGLALVCGLLGLVVHVFWLAAIVLMSVLFGLIAANVRGRGVIPELMAEAQGIADNLSNK